MEPKDRVETGSKAELGERRHVTDQGKGGQTGEETRWMGQADLGLRHHLLWFLGKVKLEK